jgi:predicted ATPase
LDNCEHVVEAASRLTAELVSRTERLRVLATSRQALRVPGELVRPIPPLGTPTAESDPMAAELASWPATRLFLDRARDVVPDFAVDDATAASIARVCRRLDGLPLAIELAAARMNAMTAQQLAEELDASLRSLSNSTCAAPDRHRTLDAAIGWSYDLLDPDERTVLTRLSVAPGGWTLAAAQQFAAGDGIDADDMLDLVSRLVAKSLVVLRSRDGLGRYAILRVIRLHAAERLAAAEEAPAVRRRHAQYYAALAQRAAVGLRGPEQRSWLKQLDVEVNNLRAALQYWRESGDADHGLCMATALWRYAYLRGRYAEGRAVLEAALRVADAAPNAEPVLRAGALVAAGTLAYLQCEYETGAARIQRGLALYREAGESTAIAAALQRLGSISRERGDYADAVARHEEGLALSRAIDDRAGIAAGLNYLGFVAWLNGDPERTEQLATEAFDQFRESPDAEGLAWTLLNLGISARYRGALGEADQRLRESLELCDQVGYAEGTAWCLDQLGALARDRGDYRLACDLQQDSLSMHAQLGDRWRAASVLEGLAITAAKLGTHQAAARLAGAAEALRRSIGTPRPPCDQAEFESAVHSVRAALGDEEFAAQARAAQPQRLLARLGETGDVDAALGCHIAPV